MQIFIKVVFILYLFLGPFENLKISNLELGRRVGGGLEVSWGARGGIPPKLICYTILGFSIVGNPSFNQ